MLHTILLALCLLLLIIVLIVLLSKKEKTGQWDMLERNLSRLESGFKDDFRTNRDELSVTSKQARDDMHLALMTIKNENNAQLINIEKTLESQLTLLLDLSKSAQKEQTDRLDKKLGDFTTSNEKSLLQIHTQTKEDSFLFRQALGAAIDNFKQNFEQNIKALNELQREKFGQIVGKQDALIKQTEERLESIRQTVEEKLEKTLSERLGQSFETVGKQLGEVQKGLGEMQTLAGDVGGLKKVLSNVKLRGGIGEVQLAMLLEQILAPVQYDANVITRKGSAYTVEFAVKLPGRSEDDGSFIYLPIDAKFPKDAHEHLHAAYEHGTHEEIEMASRNMETTIKNMAKDIHEKYLDPPHTTDFAIMFLPFESIYAEVIRRSALVDQLRDKYKIMIAGPTTLMALLNSLQMGFRTLALQKRSSEVWTILGEVKTEFENFGGLLGKAQKNLQMGMGQLDDVMGKRTRAIQRKLKDIEALPAVEALEALPETLALGGDENISEEMEIDE